MNTVKILNKHIYKLIKQIKNNNKSVKKTFKQQQQTADR